MNYEILNQCTGAFTGPFRNHMMFAYAHARFFILFFLGAMFFVLLIKFLVAWLVYKDATAKNIENKKIWFFLVFVTSILGSIFYFIMVIYQHKNNTVAKSASQTQTQTQPSVQHLSTTKVCKNCGTQGDGKFCTICGTQL